MASKTHTDQLVRQVISDGIEPGEPHFSFLYLHQILARRRERGCCTTWRATSFPRPLASLFTGTGWGFRVENLRSTIRLLRKCRCYCVHVCFSGSCSVSKHMGHKDTGVHLCESEGYPFLGSILPRCPSGCLLLRTRHRNSRSEAQLLKCKA